MAIETVPDIVRTFPKRGDSPCLGFKTDFRMFWYDYRQVHDRVVHFMDLLVRRGVKKGDMVIIWAPNSPNWACSFLAASCVGAVVIPVDFRSRPDLVVRIAREVGPAFAFIGDRMPHVNLRCKVFMMPPIWSDNDPPRSRQRIAGVNRSDLLEIVYTSGTTGRPKGVMLTHWNVVSNVLSATKGIYLSSSDKSLSLLPLSHMFEQVGGFLALLINGGSIVYLERLNRRSIFMALGDERPTFIPIVPRLLEMIKGSIELEAEQSGRRSGFVRLRQIARRLPPSCRRYVFPKIWRIFPPGSFRCFISGGAPLEVSTEQFFEDVGLPILQGYGLTETSPALTFNSLSCRKIGSVGKPIEGVEVKIGDDGEILAKGPNVTRGYYKRPCQTAELFKNGWLATGDLGLIDDDGFLYIKGRKKDLIVTSEGMNVYPEDVESALNHVKGVRDSAVVGWPRDGGEQVHAVLLLDKSAGGAGVLVAKANSLLPSYSRITGYTVWPDSEFPRTTTMKVKKFEVLSFLESSRKKQTGAKTPGVIRSPLFNLIARVTRRPLSSIKPSSNLTSDLGLASLDRVELLALVEDEIGVSLPDEAINPKTTVRDLENLIIIRPGFEGGVKFRPWLNSWPIRLIRVFLQDLIVFPLIVVFTRTAVCGNERLRKLKGPCLIVCNHTSHFDTPVILMHLPFRLREKVLPVGMWEYFIVKNRLKFACGEFKRFLEFSFKQFVMWRLYDLVGIVSGMIPFPQASGFVESMRYAGSRIDRGYSILVFPEGARTTDNRIHDFKDGVGMMAVNYKIPILPVRVSGLWEVLPRGKFWPKLHPSGITFGEPFMVKSEDYREAAREIERAVRGL